MVKKLLAALTLVIGFVLVSCTPAKYADVKEILSQSNTNGEQFFKDMAAANDAETIANLIKKSFDENKNVIVKMKEFYTKYPELNDQQNPPAELKELIEKSKGLAGTEAGKAAQEKLMQFATDPKVMEVMEKIQEETMKALQVQ